MTDYKNGKISQEYTEDISINDRSWVILNHLEEFNDCPEKIVAILERLSKLKGHKLGTQEQYYHRAYNGFYVLHNKFPDMKWIEEQCPGGNLYIEKGTYSNSIYIDFIKIMDREIVKRAMERCAEISCPSKEDFDKVQEAIAAYGIKDTEDVMDTADQVENYYDDGEDLSVGVKTGIQELDEVIRHLECMASSVIAAPSGSGKCHGLGTKILMYDGAIKNVEDVIVGDQLMGNDSAPRTVLSLARGRDQMYKINPTSGGYSFTCNRAHIMSLRCCAKRKTEPFTSKEGRKVDPSKLGMEKGDIDNISIENYLNKSNNYKNLMKLYRAPVEFTKKELPVDPYIYGLWLGDGHTKQTRITTIDSEIAEAWINCGKALGLAEKEYLHKKSEAKTYSLTKGFKNSHIANPILDFIKTSVDTEGNKRIRKDYLTSSREDRLKLLAGIIDTDGTVDPRTQGYLSITTKLESLAEDYAFLARSLGFKTSLNKRDKFVKYLGKNYISYDVNISGDVHEIPTILERKKNKPRRINKNPLNSGFKVEALGEGDYYGFELDGNHLYLLGDFTVTHNSTIASTIAYNVSVLAGKHVCYVIFEGSRKDMWFNLCSIESTYLSTEDLCSHSDWKHREGDNGELYRRCHRSMRAKLNESRGFLNIIDSKRMQHVETLEDFMDMLEEQSVKMGRKVDLVIIDNVDGLDRFRSTERDPRTAMNNKIKRLDTFATTYHKNEGTHITFLAQTNREGMETLENQESNGGDGNSSDKSGRKKIKKVDYRVISEFSALYEKARVALVCSSSDEVRADKKMTIYIVKVRNSERPPSHIKVYADFKYCKVGHREVIVTKNSVSTEEYLRFKEADEALLEAKKLRDSLATTVEEDFKNDEE